jgi:hypothetical protein
VPDPARQRGTRPGVREALLDQMRYLIVEAEALAPLLADLPEHALRAPRPDAPPVLDAFVEVASRDRGVHAVRLVALSSTAMAPAGNEAGPPAGDVTDVLAAVSAARRELVAAFERVPAGEWSVPGESSGRAPASVSELAMSIVQHDAAVLRGAAEWLRAAIFSDRQRGGTQ